jgi:GntR family transcriptional regulator
MPKQRYEEVADILRARIQDGTYTPGAKLPSRSQLREEFQASDTVIDKAMMMLRVAGFTESLAGVGVFARDRPPTHANDGIGGEPPGDRSLRPTSNEHRRRST